jgi:NAD(P)-dependent dehydrogenase (short-subunit alcohol dehydrogenase family)
VPTYLLTGGTGLIGRQLLRRLVARKGAKVYVLVRPGSVGRLAALTSNLIGGDRVTPLMGDLTRPDLGLSAETRQDLHGTIDHLVHLAALYDMTADEGRNEQVNVVGTERVVGLAEELEVRCLHHMSSVAVAGDASEPFDEDMFDIGQDLPSAYHRTKFASEQAVRKSGVPWRIYRPSIVVGDSVTGETDKVDGPYYFFPALSWVAQLPGSGKLPLVAPDLGHSNVVPVDYVATATDALMHRRGLDGRAFHLVHPKDQSVVSVYNAFARAAGAPAIRVALPAGPLSPLGRLTGQVIQRVPMLAATGSLALARLGVPPEVLPFVSFPGSFPSAETRRELAAAGVPEPPELASYADVLWKYWGDHLDPYRFRRTGTRTLQDRTVAVTGASSGIGRATALAVARHGGIPLLLARRGEELEKLRREIGAEGGTAYVYQVDLTDSESVASCVNEMLADHGGVDMLVNNAGRSIRRSVALSYDRFHDFERTMALNYFAPVRLMLALLPSMTERRFGHILNVSSIGVQTGVPRFSAYVASKAALDAFSRVAATEVIGDGVTFTTMHMPLVRTPMIAPTKMYDRFPTMSPQEAAEAIVAALEDRPKHWGTKLGTTGAVLNAVSPRFVDALLHTAYLAFPDSIAAAGDQPVTSHSAPEAISRGAVVLMRLLPGVHW